MCGCAHLKRRQRFGAIKELFGHHFRDFEFVEIVDPREEIAEKSYFFPCSLR
jgi:hypothetical protein